jgi:hypothetical protein
VCVIIAVAICGTACGIVLWDPAPPSVGPGGLRYDPIEDDPRMKPIFAAAEQETRQEIANDPPEWKRMMGYCHRVWGVKKGILKKKYGIEWRTPAEMNPNVAFD